MVEVAIRRMEKVQNNLDKLERSKSGDDDDKPVKLKKSKEYFTDMMVLPTILHGSNSFLEKIIEERRQTKKCFLQKLDGVQLNDPGSGCWNTREKREILNS